MDSLDCAMAITEAKLARFVMKLLCGGSDLDRLELARKKLVKMGIACELHRDAASPDSSSIPTYPELWIKREEDFGAATRIFCRLCAEDTIFFSQNQATHGNQV